MKDADALVFLVVLAFMVAPVSGQVDTVRADFGRHASIGGSLAAGFSSGSLHGDGQR